MKKIHVFIGGSFDPVHIGHSSLARYVYESLHQQACDFQIYFLPTAGSPFKNTSTTSADRLAMLSCAIDDLAKSTEGMAKKLSIETHEIHLTPPVFSIDTLKVLRSRLGSDSICFVMGKDSLVSLPTWKQGLELIDYCHLWVFDRGDDEVKNDSASPKELNQQEKRANNDRLSESLSDVVPKQLQCAVSCSKDSLLNHSFGSIFLDSRQPPAISSSHIRKKLSHACHRNDTENLLTLGVWEYISRHQLYNDDI